MFCCICEKYKEEFPNNAKPVKDGHCCNECNNKVVLPARIDQIKELAKSIK